jgi:AraC family transcriptional regulator
MEWSDRMNAAIDYIEENLAGEIDFNEAANRAFCSRFHFQRIFFVVIGVTLAEYIRRRRLTLAASDLCSGNLRVIDIATKYGYDSPTAFTRAFRNLHGITPQAAREPGVTLVAFPRVSFHIALEGGNDMDYKIIEKPAFEVIGRVRKFPSLKSGNYNFTKIPQFWNEFMQSEEDDKLNNLGGGKPGPVTGAMCLGVIMPVNMWEEIIYAIAIEKPANADPADFDVYQVPAATWAIFESVGPMPGAIQDVTKKIFREWFPSTGYEHDDKPELEVYLPGDTNNPDYHCQVWMPVVKKN